MERSSSTSSSSPKLPRRASHGDAGRNQPPPQRPELLRATRVVDLRTAPARPSSAPAGKPAAAPNNGPQTQQRYARLNERGELSLQLPRWAQGEAVNKLRSAIEQRVPTDIGPENIDGLHSACKAIDALLSLCHSFAIAPDVALQMLQDHEVWAVLSGTPPGVWEALSLQVAQPTHASIKLDDADKLAIATVIGALLHQGAGQAACSLMRLCPPVAQRRIVQMMLDDQRNPLFALCGDEETDLFGGIVEQMLTGPHQQRYDNSHQLLLRVQAFCKRRVFDGQAYNIDAQNLATHGYYALFDEDGLLMVNLGAISDEGQIEALANFMEDAARDAQNDTAILALFKRHFAQLSDSVPQIINNASGATLTAGRAGPVRPHALQRMATVLAQLLDDAVRKQAHVVVVDVLQCLALLQVGGLTQASACLQGLGQQWPPQLRTQFLEANLNHLCRGKHLRSEARERMLTAFLHQMCWGLREPALAAQLLRLGSDKMLPGCTAVGLCVAARNGELRQTLPLVCAQCPTDEGWATLSTLVPLASEGQDSASEALAFTAQLMDYLEHAFTSGAVRLASVKGRNEVLRALIQSHLGHLHKARKPWSAAAQKLAQWTWAVDAALNLASAEDLAMHRGQLHPGVPLAIEYFPCLMQLLRGGQVLTASLMSLTTRTLQLLKWGETQGAASAAQMLHLFRRCSPAVKQALMAEFEQLPIRDQDEAIDDWLLWRELVKRAPSEQTALLLGIAQIGAIAPGGLAPVLAGLIEEPGFPELVAEFQANSAMDSVVGEIPARLPHRLFKLREDGLLPRGVIALLKWQSTLAVQTMAPAVLEQAMQLVGALLERLDANPAVWRQIGAYLPLGPQPEQVKAQLGLLLKQSRSDPRPVVFLLAGWLARQIRRRPDPAMSPQDAAAQAGLLQAVSKSLKKLTSELHSDERKALRTEFDPLGKPH